MKIWVIGRSYPLPKNQLKGSFELEQAKMLARLGHEVTYLALNFHPFRKIRKRGYEEWSEDGVDIRVFCARSLPMRLGIEYTPYRRWVWKRFLKRAEKSLPDIIHVHYPSMLCDEKILESYQRRGVKIVSTEHWSKVLLQKLNPYETKRLKWHMSSSDGVAAVGIPLAESIKKITASNKEVSVIPNIINPIFMPNEKKKSDGIFKFITVGRLVSLRQYDKVISAFDSVFHGREDVTLTLIGAGKEYKKLDELIRKLDARKNIFLAGIKPREECAAALANSDCLICYSKYETFGVPVIEAWGCGIPVIVSEHLGFLKDAKEAGKLGITANAKSSENLCSAMKCIFEKIKEFDSSYISLYAESNFSESAVYEKIISFYTKSDFKTQQLI